MTYNEDGWTDWIEHDGRGYPEEVIGRVCEANEECRALGVFCTGPFICEGHWPDGGSWNWANYPETTRILSYRIRKPRGLTTLEQIARDVPEVIPA